MRNVFTGKKFGTLTNEVLLPVGQQPTEASRKAAPRKDAYQVKHNPGMALVTTLRFTLLGKRAI